jgi:hypothetical protein
MNDKAMEYSKRGDEVFNALAARFPDAQRWRLMLAQKLADERFAQIRLAMLAYVSSVLGSKRQLSEPEALEQLLAQRGQLPNYTSGGMLAPKREHTLEFNLLHRAVAAAFADNGIEAHVSGIDLPINVRMVYGQADAARLQAPFSSSKRHSDVWAGVPADAVVIVLPVLGAIEHITIECAEMPRELELPSMRAMPDYDEGRDVPAVEPYKGAMEHGVLYIADVRLLHQTVRYKPEGVRLSVDLRFRYNEPDYRAMVPSIEAGGPDSIDTRVPYADWLRVGTDQLIVFEETMDEARITGKLASSAPVNLAKYKLVSLG